MIGLVTDTLRMTGVLEPRGGWSADRCSIARTLNVVSTRSSLLLMREALYGTTRFGDFAARVGISEPVAAARLRELVDHGLLAREAYQEPGQRTRYEYHLTDQGADLLPALVALMQWGDRWLAPDGPPAAAKRCTPNCAARPAIPPPCRTSSSPPRRTARSGQLQLRSPSQGNTA
jgi:DNA-binding HxlR family transcriptional regulator